MSTWPPSTATKRNVVDMAYEECSLAGYEFDVTPEEQFTALRRLDALMMEWQPTLPLGYNFPAKFGGGDLDDPVGIPDFAIDVAAKYLALRISPMMGKDVSGPQRYALAAGLTALRAQCAVWPTVTLPRTTPRGTGNRYWSLWAPYILGDEQNATLTLKDLTLASYNPVNGQAWSTVINGTTGGSTLYLVDDVDGAYTLTSATTNGVNGEAVLVWSLNRSSDAPGGGFEYPIVQEAADNVFNSPNSTTFTMTIGLGVGPFATIFNARTNSQYVPLLAL